MKLQISPMAADVVKAIKVTDGTSVAIGFYLGRTTNAVGGLLKTLKLAGIVNCTGHVVKAPSYPKGAFVHEVTNVKFVVNPKVGRERPSKRYKKADRNLPQMYSCLDFWIYPKNYRAMI